MSDFYGPIRKIIETRFKTQWDSVGGGVPVQWENASFTQPAGGEWVRLVVLGREGFQASIGSLKLEKQPGVVVVTVITGKNAGPGRALVLADLVASALRYYQGTQSGVSVYMQAPSLGGVGEETDHYTINVSVPFEGQAVL